jgi:hypothetical protein
MVPIIPLVQKAVQHVPLRNAASDGPIQVYSMRRSYKNEVLAGKPLYLQQLIRCLINLDRCLQLPRLSQLMIFGRSAACSGYISNTGANMVAFECDTIWINVDNTGPVDIVRIWVKDTHGAGFLVVNGVIILGNVVFLNVMMTEQEALDVALS